MKIGIFQDVHANLPALEKAIEVFKENECSKIYHVGDLIGIGPHPREVFDLATSVNEIKFVMGNHDYWYGFGIPDPLPALMSSEEAEHQRWVHGQIGEEQREIVRSWKFIEDLEVDKDRRIAFMHYGYDAEENWFKAFINLPDSENLDLLFEEVDASMIFYGHNHESSDIKGKSRYINLGSCGCYNKPEARLGILEITRDTIDLRKLTVPYEDRGLMEDFEKRQVPARQHITKHFITRSK